MGNDPDQPLGVVPEPRAVVRHVGRDATRYDGARASKSLRADEWRHGGVLLAVLPVPAARGGACQSQPAPRAGAPQESGHQAVLGRVLGRRPAAGHPHRSPVRRRHHRESTRGTGPVRGHQGAARRLVVTTRTATAAAATATAVTAVLTTVTAVLTTVTAVLTTVTAVLTTVTAVLTTVTAVLTTVTAVLTTVTAVLTTAIARTADVNDLPQPEVVEVRRAMEIDVDIAVPLTSHRDGLVDAPVGRVDGQLRWTDRKPVIRRGDTDHHCFVGRRFDPDSVVN